MQSFTVLLLSFHVGLSPTDPWEDASLLRPPSLIPGDREDVERLRTSLEVGDESLEVWDGVTGRVVFGGLDVFFSSFLLLSSSSLSFLFLSSSLSFLFLSSSLSFLFLSSSLSFLFLSSSLSFLFLSSSLSLLFLSSSLSFLLRSREGLWGTVTVVLVGDTVAVLIPFEAAAVFCTEVSCCVCCHSSCVHTPGNRYGGGDVLSGSLEDSENETDLLLSCPDDFLSGVGVKNLGVGVERRWEVLIVTELLLLLGRGEGKRSPLVATLSNEPCRRSCGLLLRQVILLLAVRPTILLLVVTVLLAMLRHFSTVLEEWSNVLPLVAEGLVRLCFPLDTAPVEQQQEKIAL